MRLKFQMSHERFVCLFHPALPPQLWARHSGYYAWVVRELHAAEVTRPAAEAPTEARNVLNDAFVRIFVLQQETAADAFILLRTSGNPGTPVEMLLRHRLSRVWISVPVGSVTDRLNSILSEHRCRCCDGCRNRKVLNHWLTRDHCVWATKTGKRENCSLKKRHNKILPYLNPQG